MSYNKSRDQPCPWGLQSIVWGRCGMIFILLFDMAWRHGRLTGLMYFSLSLCWRKYKMGSPSCFFLPDISANLHLQTDVQMHNSPHLLLATRAHPQRASPKGWPNETMCHCRTGMWTNFDTANQMFVCSSKNFRSTAPCQRPPQFAPTKLEISLPQILLNDGGHPI